jgi:8-amino-7-oxononanoate synthase
VFEDRYNHASLLDAAKLSGAKLHALWRHLDTGSLADQLTASGYRASVPGGHRWRVQHGRGHQAPLAELARHCAMQQRRLAAGGRCPRHRRTGRTGRGSLDAAGLWVARQTVPILMGTLGKALGTAGAFVAGSEELIETLIQQARTYVYTTATPPALAWATRIEPCASGAEEGWRREKLRALVARFRAGAAELGLQLMASETPIQPLLVGDSGHGGAI